MAARVYQQTATEQKQYPVKCFSLLIVPLLLVVSIILPKNLAIACSVVGRVIDGNKQAPKGKALCLDQAIAFTSPVSVACLKTRRVVKVRDTKDLERCIQVPQVLRCTAARANCQRARSESVANKPTLIKPYGVVLRPKPIEFTWLAVAGADRYRVVIDSVSRPMVKQFTTVNRIVLRPPVGTFSIVVQGMQGEKVLASAVTTFDTLDDQASRKLDQQLLIVDGFTESPVEKVLFKLSILSDRGLVSDAIALLESQTSKNVVIQRTLADIYRDEGELEKALSAYEKAKALASGMGDREELTKAQEGYQLVSSWLQQTGT